MNSQVYSTDINKTQATVLGNLCNKKRMLTGMAVAFGNRLNCESQWFGNAQEAGCVDGKFILDIKPVKEDSLFDLASITKLFTSISALQLIEKRLLRMTDTVGQVDDRFVFLQNLSIFDLLCYKVSLQTDERLDRQTCPERLMELIFNAKAYPIQGERVYSDMHALILKFVIERIVQSTFEDYLTQSIFIPLSMFNTFCAVPESQVGRCVNYNYEHRIIKGKFQVDVDALPGKPHDPKARIIDAMGLGVSGHAGIFSTVGDMVCFAQGLLQGKLISEQFLQLIGLNRTGYSKLSGIYRQYMGLLCFSKSSVQRLSELPPWMGRRCFGLSGYTGNHMAFDPDLGVFDILLGNRCHNRVSKILPLGDEKKYPLNEDGSGLIQWPDGRKVFSSNQYVYLKDRLIHQPIYEILRERGWLNK